MKLMIASDIHGSTYYAKLVEKAFHHHKCDILLLLGDLLYHGPRNPLPRDYSPKDVIPILNSLQQYIIAVRGNCDAEVDQMVLEFPIMSDSTTIALDGFKMFASHGHIFHPDHLPPLKKGDIFVFGHIHIPVFEKKNGLYIINPGSISLPKEENAHSYMIYEDKKFTWYDENHKILKSENI